MTEDHGAFAGAHTQPDSADRAGHTPGPWGCEPGVEGYFAVFYEEEIELPTTEANARLIAAAPMLLEALVEAEAGLVLSGADVAIAEGRFVPTPTLALRAVRAAILAATSPEQMEK